MTKANPFIVHTPEQLTPENIAANFVEMYTDFPKLKEPVNMFIHGPRGAGKSIMLRSLENKVQQLLNKNEDNALPFFAIHVPIKRAFFGNPEFLRLTGWKATTVGEHLLSIYAVQYLFEAFHENSLGMADELKAEFIELWEDCGGKTDIGRLSKLTTFDDLAKFCEKEATRVRQYYVRLPNESDPDIYAGALTSFNDFVLPLCRVLVSDLNLNENDPICLMIDDADNLPEALQRVLNSWISARVAKTICIKVTTQLGYKTYRTVDGRIIESPHDFSEVNIGSVYTSNKGHFAKRIEAIVHKRLENAGITTSPKDFFPTDLEQLKKRDEIWDDLISGKTEGHIKLTGRGPSRNSDLAQRYTIPALMRKLSGSKSSHTYSYAGLQSLTDLSSGVVRWFLEPAGQMYHNIDSTLTEMPDSIPVSYQDSEISNWSREFREKLDTDPGHTDVVEKDSSLQSLGHSRENYTKLGNLLDGIGWFCRERLLDETASEQRLFSFVLSDDPVEELTDILHLGVRMGYLQKSDLASKSALGGRRPRYILSRRLGPHYRLDVSGYAAHLSVKSSDLLIALKKPKSFVKIRLGLEGRNEDQSIMDLEVDDG